MSKNGEIYQKYRDYHEEIYKNKERQRKEGMQDYFEEYTANVCTNGKDHTKMNLQTYINEFIDIHQ
ncbi:unnamed protein product [Paramecium sonneborni]|uniref:Uncharacterized protein n=1 Tax=Paramecium sonneborni TaxID=65129 RepID=A0A8S1QUB5_9CILI|nr:unnamed protein product [Paramecium sonneborni]